MPFTCHKSVVCHIAGCAHVSVFMSWTGSCLHQGCVREEAVIKYGGVQHSCVHVCSSPVSMCTALLCPCVQHSCVHVCSTPVSMCAALLCPCVQHSCVVHVCSTPVSMCAALLCPCVQHSCVHVSLCLRNVVHAHVYVLCMDASLVQGRQVT